MFTRFGKMRRFRGRMLVAVAAFAALAVFAISSTAWAVSEFYCNSCTLGSVPKVSSTAVWTANHSSTKLIRCDTKQERIALDSFHAGADTP